MPKMRSEVSEELKWDLGEIFSSREEFEKLLGEVENKIDFGKYEGKLADEEVLLECFKKMDEIDYDLEKLDVYAFMKKDLDTRDGEAAELMGMCENLIVKYSSATSFITPEITSFPEEKLRSVIADPRFKDYDYSLSLLLKNKPHVLSKESETILALGGQMYGGFHDIFTMIDNADLPFPEIEVDGEKVTVSHGVYGMLLQHPDRSVRESAYKAYYKAYGSLLNTIAATYIGNVNKDVFLARAKKYDSCLSQAMSGEDVDVKVYENLLESVHEGLPLVHRYIADRKKILGVDELRIWDIYVPLVEDADIKLDFEEAFKLVKKGLAPLGEDYGKLLQRARDERWMDVEETECKRSGAYSVCV